MTTARPACTPRPPRDSGQAGVQTGPPSAPDPRLPPLREKPQGHETEGGIREPEFREPLQPSAVRIAYQMVRHALGKWGASKVTALDIRREGDTQGNCTLSAVKTEELGEVGQMPAGAFTLDFERAFTGIPA
jgi:hypothetical protein